MMISGRRAVAAWLAAAALLRVAVSLHSYSGMGRPPQFGDYEAQRHWMEITVNLPAAEWYRNSTANNLGWWGLDYPPVSGYQSWLCGQFVKLFEPEAVQLMASRGYESPSSKQLLRSTVLAADVLIALPGAWAAANVFHPRRQPSSTENKSWLRLLVALLFSPAAVLVDHGHFQYNCIGLGLAAGAAAAGVAGHDVLCAVLFCLSLNHKQMGLYYAPAFFAFLLGKCLQRPEVSSKVGAIAKLGATVLATFGAVWAPWLTSSGAVLGVLQRLFPTQRGLYEDYVANFWCVSSRVIKWTRFLSQGQLVRLCSIATMMAAAPAMVMQVQRPSPRGLLLCMTNCALSFFLFSYQVHEKSILLPLLPLTMLLGSEDGQLLNWTNLVATFSMAPLLSKDGLGLATISVVAACRAANHLASMNSRLTVKSQQILTENLPMGTTLFNRLHKASVAGCAAILAGAAVVPAPLHLPFLHDALIVTWSFLHVAALLACTYFLQFQDYRAFEVKVKQQ